MINLKNHPEVNEIINQELTLAGIEPVLCSPYGEIEAKVSGEISSIYGKITFTRAWTYWVVKGMFPLDLANKIYAHPEGKNSVWAGGHCGKLPPLDQASFFNLDGQLLAKKSDLELLKNSPLYEELLMISNIPLSKTQKVKARVLLLPIILLHPLDYYCLSYWRKISCQQSSPVISRYASISICSASLIFL